jgi:7-cyano-7-deazaguanine reductase
MPPSPLEAFATPTDAPIVIEHVAEEFTSLCPKTGHPDFGTLTLRYEPRAAKDGGVCVELKSLKVYYQSFRQRGIFYEAVTDEIARDLAALLKPVWLQVHSSWRGRGGIRSIIRAERGDVPARYQA